MLTPEHPTLTEIALPTGRHSHHVLELCFEGVDGEIVDVPVTAVEVEFDAATGRRGTVSSTVRR